MAATPRPKSRRKMPRLRRSASNWTPYDRPTPTFLRNSSPTSPNWLSKLVFSPTRLIASGAGKALASVFSPHYAPSSSDDDSAFSDDDMDDVSSDVPPVSSQGAGGLEKKNQTSDMINCSRALEWKNDTKRVIEQLLMRETFTREECDKLMHIIKSRMVDSPVHGSTEVDRQNVNKSDIHKTAVMEAKKWLEEKKLRSNSKSTLEGGTCTFNTEILPCVSDNEEGSPVDLAKCYMQSRPPWASPSLNHTQCSSASPTGVHLFKESTLFLLGSNSASTSKLTRDSAISGSWNFLDEIRSKVRYKATEELLNSQTSSKIDWSASASDHKRSLHFLLEDKAEAGVGCNINYSKQLIDTPLLLPSHVASGDLPDDGLQNDAVLSNPVASNPQQNEDLGPVLIVEERREGRSKLRQTLQPSEYMLVISESATIAAIGPKNTVGNIQPLSSVVGETNQNPRVNKMSCSTSKDIAGRVDAVAANGFPSPGSSLSTGHRRDQDSRPYDEGLNQPDSNTDNIGRNASDDENCKLLSEGSVDVPIMSVNENEVQCLNEINSVASGSQTSSSMHHERILPAVTRQSLKRSASGKSTEKQQGRKMTRYSRRGKGRGIDASI
ncbi:hypothetical protein K2173_003616 [Erythroxylum novogranatense]|uniref:Protein KAKU4 n=1 Tax=Erythroxylum novogranatense TaxID=1862640 RepID=A0AAV8TBW6_9ROSI|nr:hypothetical protein K2173_003616 [Erythroxylum novogranatense]